MSKFEDNYESFQVSYEGEKYEIGDFLNRHPGGVEVLLSYKDKDITKAFDHIGHSNAAKKMLAKRVIKKDDNNSSGSSSPSTVNSDTSVDENVKIDKEFIIRKLFTPEDKFKVHKILGFLSLLSYIYRYFYVLPTTGTLGVNGDSFSYVTLLLHTLLSCSSLVFHVLLYRIKENPLIIYEEYRLHAIVFTLKTIFVSVYALNVEHVTPVLRTPILVLAMLGFHGLADLVTMKYGKKGVTAVRNDDKEKGLKGFGLRFYAFYQILTHSCCLKIDTPLSDIGFNALIAIQSSAFLMTLKRKNLIGWKVHAAGYSVCLFLSSFFICYTKGLTYLVYISFLFIARTRLRVNKYLMWTVFAIAINVNLCTDDQEIRK